MDNASNNDTMMMELQEYMVTRGMDFDWHGNRLSQVIRCFPHGYVLEDHPELNEYLSALSSELLNQCRQGLHRTIIDGNNDKSWYLKVLELKLNCPTRWSSSRDMIERILYLYLAVSRYIASDPALAEHAITHADYEALHDTLTILNFAHQTQELLSSDKIPTLSFAIPLYHALVDQWTQL
ncbi:hypothetical protein B0J17DRAFT_734322 [Rhizoctonia solani]|nr:hypothetical protein B0J17DRAFT_734322 [Rhizoctonia solani]